MTDMSQDAHFKVFTQDVMRYVTKVLEALNSLPQTDSHSIDDVILYNDVHEPIGKFVFKHQWQGFDDEFVFIPNFVPEPEDD